MNQALLLDDNCFCKKCGQYLTMNTQTLKSKQDGTAMCRKCERHLDAMSYAMKPEMQQASEGWLRVVSGQTNVDERRARIRKIMGV